MVEIAVEEDWAEMREVFRRAGRAAWGHILGEESLANLSAPERWGEAIRSEDPRTGVFVVRREGKAVGFIVLRPSGDDDATEETGEVDSFYTDPSVWGSGVGQALMYRGLTFLTEAGFKEATLWTESRNHRPKKFYEAAGWKLDGVSRRRSAQGGEIEELRYRMELVE